MNVTVFQQTFIYRKKKKKKVVARSGSWAKIHQLLRNKPWNVPKFVCLYHYHYFIFSEEMFSNQWHPTGLFSQICI